MDDFLATRDATRRMARCVTSVDGRKKYVRALTRVDVE
jgi:hypothetical protein